VKSNVGWLEWQRSEKLVRDWLVVRELGEERGGKRERERDGSVRSGGGDDAALERKWAASGCVSCSARDFSFLPSVSFSSCVGS
jgi:hypothetical protein